MTHARTQHARPRVISNEERIGPLLRRQRELADMRDWYKGRVKQIARKLAHIPDGERKARVREHRKMIKAALEDTENHLWDVKDELSMLRSRIKEGEG